MTKQHVMSPSPPENPPAAPLGALDNATSVSAEISQPSEHGASECGADRLDRMRSSLEIGCAIWRGNVCSVPICLPRNRNPIWGVLGASSPSSWMLSDIKLELTRSVKPWGRAFDCKVHTLRTDGGGEHRNFDMFCKSTGVRRQVSEANNQASNGKAECMHRNMLNMARCMMFASGFPSHFWGDAVQYAADILNQPKQLEFKSGSPFEILTGKNPIISARVAFGSPCTVYRDPGRKTWKPRAEIGMIFGKNDETKGFQVYLPHKKLVVTTQHVKNVETMGAEENQHLQKHLHQEDLSLQAVKEKQNAAEWKELHATQRHLLRRGKRVKGRSKRDTYDHSKHVRETWSGSNVSLLPNTDQTP
uniref:Copia LTR rider putative n=1 Tax=Albugo laibachii Nc14 TaxID=890382 RepID=F0WIE6_9STRA|nr:copia LTR rider putative [Albugo laibachii Nc14]|eukprot:CCA21027.1 copia LTR rider putative [Albugo laibachii Nc14]